MWILPNQGRRFIALALLGAGLAAPVGAASFVVNSTGDTVAADPATSPKDASGSITLRSAIMAANAQAGPDVITLAPGAKYVLTLGPADSALGALDDSRGDLDISDELTLLGEGATVDAGSIDRVFAIERPDLQDVRVSIERLTIQGGAPRGVLTPGGGISVRAATLEMTDCVVSDNTTVEPGSSDNGGGIAANGVSLPVASLARLTLQGCTIAKNAANNGGGILAADCLLTLSGCRFENNVAVGTDAGTGGGNLFLAGSKTQAVVSNTTIAGGLGSADGGGLSLFSAALQVEATTISGNAADGDGGGLFDSPVSPGSVSLRGTTLGGNHADGNADGLGDGGGSFLAGGAELMNVTVSGNTAVAGGGLAGPAIATLSNVTVANNLATKGGGLFPVGVMTLHNTLVAGNTAGDGPDASGALGSMGYNLIGNPSGLTISGDLTGNQLGVSPMLAPLADNGGPTRTHALLVGSPAIDAAAPGGFPFVDQRGVPRPQDGDGGGDVRADIGAYEFLPAYVVAEVVRALRIAGGLLPASELDMIRLDVGDRDEMITVADAILLARKAAGSVANP